MLVNGQSIESISASDRGLAYGDGLFETVAVRDAAPELWPEHIARLKLGCERLAIPYSDEVEADAARLFEGVERGVLKIIVTRGAGGRGYRSPEGPEPTRILSIHPWPDYPVEWWREGIAVRLCDTPLGINPRLAGIKHLNRLEQVLARAEWSDPTITEGLMRDADGRIIEGVVSNLFLVRDGAVLTPSLGHCGVAGVMRGAVMQAAESAAIECIEGEVWIEALRSADELFLTNSLMAIQPVTRLGESRWPIGPLTRRLQQALTPLGVVR